MCTVCRVASELFICKVPSARNEKNVRLVAASALVEKLPLRGDVHGLAAGNISEENDGVRHPALRANQDAFEIARLVGFRVADLRVFVD